MTLKDTGLLPEKDLHNPECLNFKANETWCDCGTNERNSTIDKISAIEFNPLDFVDIDEENLREFMRSYCQDGRLKFELAHAIAQNKEKWMKERKP